MTKPSTIKNKAAKKPTKKRATKYDEKLQVKGTFEDLVKELITPKQLKT